MLEILDEIKHIERLSDLKLYIQPLTSLMAAHIKGQQNEQKTEVDMSHLMELECPPESLAALHIQRKHEIDKKDRCKKYTFLCSLAMDMFSTHTH